MSIHLRSRIEAVSQAYHNDPDLAFWQVYELDLFDGNSLAGAPIQSAVNTSKSTFSQAIAELLFKVSHVS